MAQDDIDIERLVRQLREGVRQRQSVDRSLTSAMRLDPFADEQPARALARLRSDHDVRDVPFHSHRAVLGGLVIVLKRALRQLLTPILERQATYNAANTLAIEHVKECLEKLDRRQLQALHGISDRLEKIARLGDSVVDIAAQLGEVRATQSAMAEGVQAARSQVQQTLGTQQERIALAERKLRRALYVLHAGLARGAEREPAARPAEPSLPPPEVIPAFDYAGFEELFRGSEAVIKERQDRFAGCFTGRDNVLDIGCGRGEFLELLRDRGIRARGIDIDLDMVLLCQEKGLDVVREDAFAYLAGLPDDSLGGVYAAQVIEHLPPPRIIELVRLCHRKLTPGATLILETPNPNCLIVLADSFYRDFSHIRPVHPDTMVFLLRSTRFDDVELHFTTPFDPEARIPSLQIPGADLKRFNEAIERLNELLYGAQDYVVLGRKGRDAP